MALAGKGVLAIWNGIDDEAEADFVAWHIGEHIPERVAVPGFLRGRRYVAVRGTPKYFNFYETETPEVLVSPDYLARLNAPSPWTQRVVRHFRETSRTVCRVAQSRGLGDGVFVATLRLVAHGERDAFVDGLGTVMGKLQASPSIVAVHLLEGQGGGGGATAEKALRSEPDQTADWILLVEAVEAAPLEAALSAHAAPETLSPFTSSYDTARDCGIYQLQYGLAKGQIA